MVNRTKIYSIIICIFFATYVNYILFDFSSAYMNEKAIDFIYSTLIGGSEEDGIIAVEYDSEGNTILGGSTKSIDFPITDDAFQPIYGGESDDSYYFHTWGFSWVFWTSI